MASTDVASSKSKSDKKLEQLESVVIRFCGDSGDGMQLAGTQFTNVSAVFGNDVSTLPDFPAEIRAPAGSLAGVSGFQLSFSDHDIYTPGDEVDTLVAMNPAAFKTNLKDLKKGGTLIVNNDAFDRNGLTKAAYTENPLDDESLASTYNLHRVSMTRLTRDAVDGLGLSTSEADRSKNFFALGLVFWLYDRDHQPTLDWVTEKFAKKPTIAEANIRSLKAGRNYGDSTEAFTVHYFVAPAKLPPGNYRKITGNEALAFGLVTAAKQAGQDLFFAGYPITPASDILHELSKLKNFGVRTFQAEDEIAAIASAVGASFAGQLAVTATSGPGICLKGEAMGLAVITELPLVIVNVQRGGPSTGLPTKTEQSDLLLSMFGRNGESPLPVLAAASPSDCFEIAQQAMRIAVEYMTPVVLLSDGYIGNGAEPWKIPDSSELVKISVSHPQTPNDNGEYSPYLRNDKLVRPWAIPGTPNLEHRLGGLEKANITGNVEYSPENHQLMTDIRENKIKGIANDIPEQELFGADSGKLLVMSWGGTFGAVRTAVQTFLEENQSVAHAHLRYLNPFPRNLGEVIGRFEKVLIPELNKGQLKLLIRSEFLVDAKGFNKVQGKPFLVREVRKAIENQLKDNQ